MRPQPLLHEFRALPPREVVRPAATQAVTLIIPARRAERSLERVVVKSVECLRGLCGTDHEVVVVPNGLRHEIGTTLAIAHRLERTHASVRVVRLGEGRSVGKGAAVREGLLAARGERVLLTDADLPYRLDFFERAWTLLESGVDLVTGNRRIGQSVFEIPVPLLHLAYARHRQGLWFNRVARGVLPIETLDTQAGIKAMSRSLATDVASRMTCPGFLFDLEIFLVAKEHGRRTVELPVRFVLSREDSTVDVVAESAVAAWWLGRILAQHRLGHYGPARAGSER